MKKKLFINALLTVSLSIVTVAANAKPLKAKVRHNKINIAINDDRITANEDDILSHSIAIDQLDSRLNTLEQTTPSNSTTLSVDCATSTISDALANATPAGALRVEITGTCSDNIVITRDNVSLIGLNNATINYSGPININTYRTTIENVITVIGANNVVIQDLTLNGATAGASLRLFNNAAVLLTGNTLSGSQDGTWASNNSSLQMSNNNIQSNSRYGVLITDGSTAEIREANTISNSASRNGALALFRNASTRVSEGNNTITNSFANGSAIETFHGAQFRSDNGALTINGEIDAGFFGQVELRDTTVNGRVQIFPKGLLRVRPNNTVNINGNIEISGTGLTQLSNASNTATINGDIICLGYNAAIFGTGNAIINGSADLNNSCNQ